jgi:hypothetical protein
MIAAGTASAAPADEQIKESAATDFLALEPQNGTVTGTVYDNPYFGLKLTLPEGWTEGLAGPPPSQIAYYALTNFDEPKPGQTSLLVAAQDLFFGAKSFSNAAEMTADFKAGLPRIPNMVIEDAPEKTTLGGHEFLRIDYNAGGLFRTWLAGDVRCHALLMNFTGTERAAVDKSVEALKTLTLDTPNAPPCIKGYTTQSNITHLVVLPNLPKGLKIPVRLVIDADGHVKHVHVVRTPDPTLSEQVRAAMLQWTFKPYQVDGKATLIETGIALDSNGVPQ